MTEFKEQAVKHVRDVKTIGAVAKGLGLNDQTKSDGVLRERNTVKYAWIDEHSLEYGLDQVCAVLDISITGYRA